MAQTFSTATVTLIACIFIIGTASSVGAGEATVTLVQMGGNFNNFVIPPPVRTYTADQVDTLLKTKSDDLDKAKAELNTTIAADHETIRKQINEGLSALGQNLITEEVKQKMADDVATLVQQRVNAQVDQMKAEMKAEILAALTEKIKKIKQ
jgi:hypothetical protein